MSEDILDIISTALAQPGDASSALEFNGLGSAPSAFRSTDFAAATMASAGLGVAAFASLDTPSLAPGVSVDRRLATFWFASSIRPLGWEIPPTWDDLAADYIAEDGWIRLHTNAPHHRAAALSVLGVPGEHRKVAREIARRKKAKLEQAVVEAGGCAAAMYSRKEWASHEQGAAVATEPLADISYHSCDRAARWRIDRTRPLKDIKVLDLTRILAGPVATRFLAGYGANVLRIDPPDWEEPAAIPEVGLGKWCARLDLKSAAGLEKLEQLIRQADVLVHGYRSDALERLGIGADARRKLQPCLIDVGLDAYGWSGPWRTRRGFDSLVQMSSGLADAGMQISKAGIPTPLPMQALDHGTGYMMAAAVMRGLAERITTGRALSARFSLARTAELIARFPAPGGFDNELAPEQPEDHAPEVEQTDWGPARRLRPAIEISGIPMWWDIAAGNVGRHKAEWPD